MGSLRPGERLTVRDLAEAYETSSTPVREAIARLAADGLVATSAYKGSVVAPISSADLDDLYKLRTHLEFVALTVTLNVAGADWDSELERAFSDLDALPIPFETTTEATTGDSLTAEVSSWEEVHRRFHLTLVSRCQSRWLMRFIELLYDHSVRYRCLARSLDGPSRAVRAEHAELFEASRVRDTGLATLRLAQHLSRTVETLKAAYAVDLDPIAAEALRPTGRMVSGPDNFGDLASVLRRSEYAASNRSHYAA